FPNPVFDKVGTTITCNLALNETDFLFFQSSSDPGRDPFHTIQISHTSSNVVYFGDEISLPPGVVEGTPYPTGTIWKARSSIHTDIRVYTSDGKRYGGPSNETRYPWTYSLPLIPPQVDQNYFEFRDEQGRTFEKQWVTYSNDVWTIEGHGFT